MKTAVVTGASGAIGGAIARDLLNAGYRVIGVGRDADRLRQEMKPATEFADRCSPLVLDLDGAQAAAVVEGAVGPTLDVLVHAAGLYRLENWAGNDESALRDLLRSHAEVPWRLTRALLPQLRQGRGEVIFVNSSVAAGTGGGGGIGASGIGPYAAAKAAERALADSLRQEVNSAGVRVLSVYPGRTAGRIQESLHAAEGQPYEPGSLLQPVDVAAAILAAIRLPRTAEITDLHLRPFEPPSRR